MKKTLFFTGIITVAFVILSCGSCKKARQNTRDTTAANKPETEVSTEITQKELSGGESMPLAQTRWKLVELNGKPVSEMTFAEQPYIVFDNESRRVSGSAGCNSFSGEYELNEVANRIRFSKMIATQKMCLDMTVEDQFLQVLSVTDNYSTFENTLSLNRARMAPLARFEK